jgi:hypothetical protein
MADTISRHPPERRASAHRPGSWHARPLGDAAPYHRRATQGSKLRPTAPEAISEVGKAAQDNALSDSPWRTSSIGFVA